MENAIIINRIEDFKYWNKKYNRIYLGNEFCYRLLPDRKELENIIKIARKKRIKITLLTGQIDSQGLRIVKKIIKYLNKEQVLEEAIINDYGILNYLKRTFPNCQIILGRMLSRFVRLDQNSFLYKMNIRRLEFDSLDEIKIKKQQLSNISYYYPYSFFSVSRYCPVADIFNNRSENHGIIKCSKECLKIGELKINNPIFKKSAILKGNALFIKNKVNFKILDKKGINRLVFQPHMLI